MKTLAETDRIRELEARLEALEAAENGRRPVIFDDLFGPVPAQVMLVHKSVLGLHAERLRALLQERKELAGELRNLRSRQRTAALQANRLLTMLQGDGRGFGAVLPSGEARPSEEEVRAERQKVLREADELAGEIERSVERLRGIMREIEREWIAVPVGHRPFSSDNDPLLEAVAGD